MQFAPARRNPKQILLFLPPPALSHIWFICVLRALSVSILRAWCEGHILLKWIWAEEWYSSLINLGNPERSYIPIIPIHYQWLMTCFGGGVGKNDHASITKRTHESSAKYRTKMNLSLLWSNSFFNLNRSVNRSWQHTLLIFATLNIINNNV